VRGGVFATHLPLDLQDAKLMQDRRTLLKMMALSSGLSPLIATAAQAQDTLSITAPGAMPASGERPVMDMDAIPADWFGSEQVGILIYDQMTALDVVGPQHFLAGLLGATIHLVSRTDAPVTSDTGVIMTPTATFDSCPRDLDVLLAGGGMTGTLTAMRDDATLDFLADRGARAGWVSSVCTGSLLLGQAGLLRGYRATSHWITRSYARPFRRRRGRPTRRHRPQSRDRRGRIRRPRPGAGAGEAPAPARLRPDGAAYG
jgi:putative intracellular protease/amidase